MAGSAWWGHESLELRDAPAWARANRQRTLADRAYDAIHEGIVTGILAPGERLVLEDLAAKLDQSLTPIREALQRLEAVGLIEHVPHRGARVTGLSMTDLRGLGEPRLALEPLAITRAAQQFSTDMARRSRQSLDRLRAAELRDDFAAAWHAHTDFHFSLYEPCGSSWLLRLIRPLWESSQRYRMRWTPLQADLPTRDEEHESILAACIRCDGVAAARELHNHLARTANRIAEQMDGSTLFQLIP